MRTRIKACFTALTAVFSNTVHIECIRPFAHSKIRMIYSTIPIDQYIHVDSMSHIPSDGVETSPIYSQATILENNGVSYLELGVNNGKSDHKEESVSVTHKAASNSHHSESEDSAHASESSKEPSSEAETGAAKRGSLEEVEDEEDIPRAIGPSASSKSKEESHEAAQHASYSESSMPDHGNKAAPTGEESAAEHASKHMSKNESVSDTESGESSTKKATEANTPAVKIEPLGPQAKHEEKHLPEAEVKMLLSDKMVLQLNFRPSMVIGKADADKVERHVITESGHQWYEVVGGKELNILKVKPMEGEKVFHNPSVSHI